MGGIGNSLGETDGAPGSAAAFTPPIEVGVELKGNLGSLSRKDDLNNMVQDASMIHEMTSYTGFHDLGVSAPHVGYTYLTINGESYGLHLNIETQDKVAMEKQFGPFQVPPQHVYEGEYGADVTSARSPDIEVKEGEDSEADLASTAAPPGQFQILPAAPPLRWLPGRCWNGRRRWAKREVRRKTRPKRKCGRPTNSSPRGPKSSPNSWAIRRCPRKPTNSPAPEPPRLIHLGSRAVRANSLSVAVKIPAAGRVDLVGTYAGPNGPRGRLPRRSRDPRRRPPRGRLPVHAGVPRRPREGPRPGASRRHLRGRRSGAAEVLDDAPSGPPLARRAAPRRPVELRRWPTHRSSS